MTGATRRRTAAFADANSTIRGIRGAHVNRSVRCEEGRLVEGKVDLKVALGVERAERP